jgi:hypothetical protein
MFAYANAECIGSIPMSAYANAHTARLESMFVFVYACIQSILLDFCLFIAVFMVTQIETVVINLGGGDCFV